MLDDGAFMPTRAHGADAGLDLYATKDAVIFRHGSEKFDTGVHIEIPDGYVGFLKSKSGLNVKSGITSEMAGSSSRVCLRLVRRNDAMRPYRPRWSEISTMNRTKIATPSAMPISP